jgi:hypothetical protein
VGAVTEVGRDDALFKSLRVRTFFSFRDLSRLAVLLEKRTSPGLEAEGER